MTGRARQGGLQKGWRHPLLASWIVLAVGTGIRLGESLINPDPWYDQLWWFIALWATIFLALDEMKR